MDSRGTQGWSWALVLVALLGSAQARAQDIDVLVSLTADDTLASEVVRDQDLVFHAPGESARVAWPSETLSLLAGDGQGSQSLHLELTDIDAIHDGGGATAGEGLSFSIPNDQAGFKDGDLLRFGAAGIEIARAEADFVAATGATDGNVDVDALQIDANGTVVFSFADNEASSVLSGDGPGVIEDGDVLSWAAGAATATMLYTENQVDTMVTNALASSSTTTDTSGLARDPFSGALLFTVLSPTAQDASVFSVAQGGRVVDGQAEADFGFLGAAEADALAVVATSHPALTTSSGNPAAGSPLTLTLRGAKPAVPQVVLSALGLSTPGHAMQGWGGFVLAHDMLLGLTASSMSFYVIVPDALGTGALSTNVPPGIAVVDVVMQAVMPGPGATASNPLVLELAQ